MTAADLNHLNGLMARYNRFTNLLTKLSKPQKSELWLVRNELEERGIEFEPAPTEGKAA